MNNLMHKKIANLGAIIGLIAFLFVGLIPSLLYGGYMGMMMGQTLFGSLSSTWIPQAITYGGMILGVCATGALFLILGVLFVTSIYILYSKVSTKVL
jgi:hypothetical protein